MRNFLKALGLSVLEAIITIVILAAIVRLKLPMTGIYIVFGITAVLFPLILLLLYRRFCDRETLIVVPVSLILSAIYSLGVSLYSYYGSSSFSNMFQGLMYFIYFLPSVVYCGVCWVIFAIMARISRGVRR
ncbi:hypothetical protein LY28_02285 [Ruminiclostridium sufflavum DSM 19573]|uniref:Uncharacterized protein n=1 Tax=Ruminiclostridium sufflavum DSM 19573 TaxID=1121337 RepID=A0A318XNJ2_9FIRM|nr:hypothetical protein [Ruminiclostridium sufflavum]PYG87149.1 hypothetical protein LY28_02285 [Ruminiclostridium sufflavum DSM 19573]